MGQRYQAPRRWPSGQVTFPIVIWRGHSFFGPVTFGLRSHYLRAGVFGRSDENPLQHCSRESRRTLPTQFCRLSRCLPVIVRCVRPEQENRFAAGAKASSGACSYEYAHSPNCASKDDYAAYDPLHRTDDYINPSEYVAPHHELIGEQTGQARRSTGQRTDNCCFTQCSQWRWAWQFAQPLACRPDDVSEVRRYGEPMSERQNPLH